jgi:hypothetical protein
LARDGRKEEHQEDEGKAVFLQEAAHQLCISPIAE